MRRQEAELRRSREQPNAFARDLFDGLPARYDLLEELLSFGQNRRWRTAMVDSVAQARPSTVLDRLEGKGMIERLPDADDRRKIWVHAVEWYDKRVIDAYTSITQQMEDIHARYTVADLQTVLRYLNDIKDVR
jgi:hypothetical protein